MKTVVCGIGNSMKGDDGIGPAVIEKLKKENLNPEDVMLIDCGTAPENFLGRITWFDPARVIIVDAVDMGREPGTVETINTGSIIGDRVSTHNLPLSMFVSYLKDMFRNSLDIVFIGAQPNQTGFGLSMSEKGRLAVDEIKGRLMGML